MRKASWTYRNPVRICFERGGLGRLREFTPESGLVLLVTTAGFTRRGTTAFLRDLIGPSRLLVHDTISPNPELDDLDVAVARFQNVDIRSVVALGGGSVLDAAKVLSVALPAGISEPLDKMFRQGQDIKWSAHIPVIAIPTTSGTGAEVTPFSTVWDRSTHKKHSVGGEIVIPELALLDPELTVSLPARETLYTGLDAVSHALESLWNKNRTALSEAHAAQALSLANCALPRVLEAPEDIDARSDMQQSSMLAGLAISQTRTAIAHSISYPLTSRYGIPHGLACSFTLPRLIDAYLAAGKAGAMETLLERTRNMLQSFMLGRHVAGYVAQEQILALRSEMYTPGRADNFDGDLNGMDRFLLID